MKHGILFLIMVIGLPLLLAVPPAQARGVYKIMMMNGNVKIISEGKTHAATANEELGGGEIITTGPASLVDIAMGGAGYMRIQENSRVSVASLKKGKGDSDMDMSSGKVLVIMSKIIKGNNYEVKTRTQVASVRGTIFQVSGSDDGSDVDVLSGKVLVNPVVNGMAQRQIEEMVSEGQSLSLDKLLVLDIIAKKKKLTMKAMRSEVRELLMKQVGLIRQLPEFKNEDLRKEIDEKILKIKADMKEKNLDRKSLKEKLQKERERVREEMKSPDKK